MDILRSILNSPLSPLTPQNCKTSPGKCLQQIILDAFIFTGIYCIVLSQLKQPQHSPDQILSFIAIYTSTLFACKALSTEYHEMASRALGITLFNKVLSVMIPFP